MRFIPAETDFVEMVQSKIASNHFMHYLGLKITSVNAAEVEAELDLQPHHLQQINFVHGGVTATVADIVAGFAAFTLVKKGQGVVTADLKISYLNPGVGKKLKARGTVLKAGNMLHFCESEIWVNDVLIAKASAIMVVIN